MSILQSKKKRASEAPIDEVYIIYGKSGTGKTVLASTFPKTKEAPMLYLDILEGGIGSVAAKDKELIDWVPIETFEELDEVLEDVVRGYSEVDGKQVPVKYSTIVVDSLTQLEFIIKKHLKSSSNKTSMTLQLWGQAKDSQEDVLILKRREADKALTFLKDWLDKQVDGMIYPTFNLHTTVTGRTSCNNPNFQQVPRNKKLKTLFQSTDPEWEMVCMDYSQAELRTAAVVAGVEAIKFAYNNGEDLHRNMAALVAGIPREEVTKQQRTQAKAINFGYLYGMQAKSFVEYAKLSYGVDVTLEDATRIRNKFFESYHELPKYYKDTQEQLMTKGYVTSIMGRRYKVSFKDLHFPDLRQKFLRRVLNFPVQSAASDIMLCALIEIHNTMNPDEVKMVATVHDSVEMLIKKNENFKRFHNIQQK